MKKQKIAVLGPGSWGTALAQVLNDNGHEVRIWGNIPEQIDEINEKHTNTRYFKDVILDENIKAYKELSEALDSVNAILFVVPTKVTRLVAKQVAELLDHKVVVMHWNQEHTNASLQSLKRRFLRKCEVRLSLYLAQVMLKKLLFVTSP